MKKVIQKCLLLDFDAWFYLSKKSFLERGGSREDVEKLRASQLYNFQRLYKSGYKKVCDGDLGGGYGPNPSTWYSWTTTLMSTMLVGANIPFTWSTEERFYL